MPANATIKERPEISKASTAGQNMEWNPGYVDPNMFRKPEYDVYIYSISRRSHNVLRPPLISKLTLKARPEGEPYIMVARFSHPFPQLERDDNGNFTCKYHDARRIAADICNPNNLSFDQNRGSDEGLTVGDDRMNLNKKGIFWSLNDPTLPEEIQAAQERLTKYYRSLLNEADSLENTSPNRLYEKLYTNLDYRYAADFFGESKSWHKVRAQAAATCPNCGEGVKNGIAFHKDSDGDLCVIDWKRAYEAGKVTKDQVPEGKEWWDRQPADVESVELEKQLIARLKQ